MELSVFKMMSFKNRIVVLFFFLCITLLNACHTPSISNLPQEDGIARIKSNYDKKDWESVIAYVSEFRARYPYSKFINQADLMQADAYYHSDKFAEAILAYEDFIKKNPSDPSTALANYRIAKSYDFQAPDVESRDQSNTKKAIDKYNYYRQNYPNSEWVSEAQHRVELLTRRMADSNAFVANYYWNRDLYAAALSRYLILLQEYSQYEDLKKLATDRAARCYNVLANELEKNPDSKAYVFFQNETSEGLRSKAQELLE